MASFDMNICLHIYDIERNVKICNMCHFFVESDSSYKQSKKTREEPSVNEDLSYVNALLHK